MDTNQIRIGIVGVGRGGPSSYHARSFSSIINGFDPDKVPEDWPVHPIRLEGAKVEAVWDEDIEAAQLLAKVFSIPKVEKRMEDIIKSVDGVILTDDITMTHQKKAPFFINEGVPTFIDKPLSNNFEEASSIIELAEKKGTLVMSTSALRYAKETEDAKDEIEAAGVIDCAMTICQGQYMKAENIIHYGIHPLELAYSVLGAGVEYVQNVGEDDKSIVKIAYKDGRRLLLLVFPEIAQVFQLSLYGKNKAVRIEIEDWDYFYWNMLRHFVLMIKDKKLAVPLQETLELIRVLTSGRESLINGGKRISFT
jgi:predicted dehydrogenase